MLHSIYQQIWRTQQWPQEKDSFFFPIPKTGKAKECSNYRTIALISHDSKVMLKIPQARLQQYMNHELQDIRLDLEGQRNQRSNCQHPLDHRKSKRVPASTSASLTMPKPLTVWITTHWKILQEMGITRPPYRPPEKPVCRSRSNS